MKIEINDLGLDTWSESDLINLLRKCGHDDQFCKIQAIRYHSILSDGRAMLNAIVSYGDDLERKKFFVFLNKNNEFEME